MFCVMIFLKSMFFKILFYSISASSSSSSSSKNFFLLSMASLLLCFSVPSCNCVYNEMFFFEKTFARKKLFYIVGQRPKVFLSFPFHGIWTNCQQSIGQRNVAIGTHQRMNNHNFSASNNFFEKFFSFQSSLLLLQVMTFTQKFYNSFA